MSAEITAVLEDRTQVSNSKAIHILMVTPKDVPMQIMLKLILRLFLWLQSLLWYK